MQKPVFPLCLIILLLSAACLVSSFELFTSAADQVAADHVAAAHVAAAQQAKKESPKNASPKISPRPAWTTSRIKGSPERPAPYRTERAFPKLQKFNKPTIITADPTANRLFVVEHDGRVLSFNVDAAEGKANLVGDLRRSLGNLSMIYGFTLHPQYAKNGLCYVCYVTKKGGPQGTRVSRFKMKQIDPPEIDPESEIVIYQWLSGGHNGGCLKFGSDGMLYISTGDGGGPIPPDPLDSGQDLTNALSCILRMDVDHQEKDKNYAVPKDNPFLKTPGALPEIWAYGFRNPWRMSFDRATGDLWVGDVGWQLWELVYRVERGGNYGWSIKEGSKQYVHPERKRGPTPIINPIVEHPHSESVSVTGGYVYRGKRLKDLIGAYLYGDFETGKFWALRYDSKHKKILSHQHLADSTLKIVSFGEDNHGEIYILNYYQGTIHTLVKNTQLDTSARFPTQLSQTGLFKNVSRHQLANGVVPFEINVPQWADNATAQRMIGVPGSATIPIDRNVGAFPDGTVLAKTISLEMRRGEPASRRNIETQILHFENGLWRGYTYRWNKKQTDATLVPVEGDQQSLTILDAAEPGGKTTLNWRFHSRSECALCHHNWGGHRLAFTVPQLNRNLENHSAVSTKKNTPVNQLDRLAQIGLFKPAHPDRPLSRLPKFADPKDEKQELTSRVRAYLHVHCSQCHRKGGGGTATIDLQHSTAHADAKMIGVRPTQGPFSLLDARIVAPGDPYRSVLYYRISKTGPGRMPHVGSRRVDPVARRLLADWIKQLPPAKQAKTPPALENLRKRQAQWLMTIGEHSNPKPAKRDAALVQLLSTTSGAMQLLTAIEDGKLTKQNQQAAVQLATKNSPAVIADLFERFLPQSQRKQRLGEVIQSGEILKLIGDKSRGRDVFLNTAGVSCKSCHKIGEQGTEVGPDLTKIGSKLDRAKLLENILKPSATIDPKYVVHLVETEDGEVLTGLLVEKTKKIVAIKDTTGKTTRLNAESVVRLVPQRRSLMPDLLLRDLTAQQVADLLTFLESCR